MVNIYDSTTEIRDENTLDLRFVNLAVIRYGERATIGPLTDVKLRRVIKFARSEEKKRKLIKEYLK